MALHKIVHLYTECVITAAETLELIEPLLMSKKNGNYLAEAFKEIILSRENGRRQAKTNVFKPLNDLEFKLVII
jgi:hypothetical protein